VKGASGEFVVETSEGVRKTKTMRRQTEAERWKVRRFEEVTG